VGKHTFPGADELVDLVTKHGTLTQVSRALGIPQQTLHAYISRQEAGEHPTLRSRIDKARQSSTAERPERGSQIDWPAKPQLAKLVEEAPTLVSAAASLGVPVQSLISRCTKVGIDTREARQTKRSVVKGDRAELTSSQLRDAHELMAERGLNPDEWSVKSCVVNEWGLDPESGEPYKQFKLMLERKPDLEWVFPATNLSARPIAPSKKPSKGTPTRCVLVGDHQAPYHSAGAHDAFLRFLDSAGSFDRIVHVGDLLDLPTISRHRDSAVYNASVQDCIDIGCQILKEISEHARAQNPDVHIDFIVGNHDERIRTELLLRAERMFNIKPAQIPGFGTQDDSLSLRRLLHLDGLGIELHDDPAGYKHVELQLSDRFVVRHGWLTGQNAAKKTLEVRGTGIAVGHTHAKRSTWVSKYVDGKARTDIGVELGTMSQTKTGIGFAVLPDWHPGWATVTIHDDGLVSVDHAVYHEAANNGKGEVLWRDQRF
jgi:hypothetical protein